MLKRAFNTHKLRQVDAYHSPSCADVKAGTWTFEKMSAIVLEKGSRDLNGDQEIDIYNDGFGLASQLWHAGITEFFAQGGNISDKDEEGMPILNLYTDKNANIISRFMEFAQSDAVYLKDGLAPWEMFESSRLLFWEADFDATGLLRTVSGFEYGIIPIPKYDENQKEYITSVNAATNIICVPRTNPNLERTSIILEAWAEDSHYKVIPVYYENALRQKGTMDEISKEMLDLIRAGTRIDILYFMGGIADLDSVIVQLYQKKEGDFASFYAANEEQAKQNIAAMIATYQNNATA